VAKAKLLFIPFYSVHLSELQLFLLFLIAVGFSQLIENISKNILGFSLICSLMWLKPVQFLISFIHLTKVKCNFYL
jgi:hypothetical protein